MIRKFLFLYCLLMMLALSVAGVVITRAHEARELEMIRRHAATGIRLSAAVADASRSVPELTRFLAEQAGLLNGEVSLYNGAGELLGTSAPSAAPSRNANALPEVYAARAGGLGMSERNSPEGEAMLYVAARAGGGGHVLHLAYPLTADLQAFIEYRRNTYGLLLTAGLIALAAGAWLLRQNIRPVEEIVEVTEAIGRGDWERKAPLDLDGEMGRLAVAVNRMSEELSRRLEAQTRENEKLAMLLTTMQEGVVLLGGDGRVLQCNASAAALLKTPPLEGRVLIEEVRHNAFIETLHAAGRDRASRRLVVELHGRALEFSLTPARAASGVLIVIRDITDLHRFETLRREFVGNVSHELRTPLTILRGFVETLLDGALEQPEDARRFLEKIHKHVLQLHNLVEDILLLSKLESRPDVAAFAEVQPLPLLRDILSDMDPIIRRKRQAVTLDAPADLPPIDADAALLGQALRNLVENAVKYTPEGGSIAIRAAVDESNAVFQVQDNGVGIPEADQARIFERFYRVDKSRSREMGGTGLGLSIVKHVAQLHGGSITVASEPGRGSTFVLLIPRRR